MVVRSIVFRLCISLPRLLPLLSLLLLFSAKVIAGGLAPPTSNQDVQTADDPTTVGNLSWEIAEESTKKVLGTGTREILASDVQVIADSEYLEQRIPLSDGFYLKLNAGREDKPFIGFGMAAGRDYQQTFCWEWFNVAGPNRAVKLQEKGELEFESEKLGKNYEVTKTKFLTDISMRVADFEKSPKPGEFDWRVKIMKGSEVEWPTVAGKKILRPAAAKEWHDANPPQPGFWERLLETAAEETSSSKRAE